MRSTKFTVITLVFLIFIAGITQGLILPMLSIILEKRGVSTLVNGFNNTAIYVGMLLILPWIETPLRRFGYRTIIIFGLALVTISTIFLPLFHSLSIWFILRLIMGMGDSAIHYASQIWITQIAPEEKRGRYISLYGLLYGLGFSIGPLGINLLPLGLWVPFAVVSLCCAIAFLMLGLINNMHPSSNNDDSSGGAKYTAVIRYGWLAFIPPLLYGYNEASLNGSFPIYALRIGVSPEWISLILPSFVIGNLILQYPIGILSDRIGRKPILTASAVVACISFVLFPYVSHSVWMMMCLLAIAGAGVGSFYALGLAYAADVLPKSMVPTAGLIAMLNFSTASMVAPSINGYVLGNFPPGMMFNIIGTLLGLFVILSFLYRPKKVKKNPKDTFVSEAKG
ncbi:MFS transporter [Bacillus sp. ISL-34]|uniref:MFS transporter n=1 Tax=Bacillus sp. ISL-34 TaxID=2819121 RepID=UPI001BE691DB|nr:MFS transporter [Bacillus sp. ISL-34]MBT2650116.1 MFS transporter [Bacillus sp. ISL-34]